MTQSLNAWITCPIPNPRAKLRLFCFHYAGGGIFSFRNWAQELSPMIEVCLIQLPGRERRVSEAAFTRMEPLIRALKRAILPYLNQPFVCFGHSFGGLVAFELVRCLRRDYRLHPRHLFVSAYRAPQLSKTGPPIHGLPDAEFLEEIRRLKGTPDEVLASTELMSFLLPTLRADFAVIETYIYQDEPPLDCSITAFGGLEDTEVSYDDLAAWRSQTNSNFSLQMLPGDHFFLHSARSHLLKLLFAECSQFLN